MLKTYSIYDDFPNHVVNSAILIEKIVDSINITTELDYINIDGDDCKIYFSSDLTQDEITELDSIVDNHDEQYYNLKAVCNVCNVANINYNFLGLHKEEIIDSKGSLVTVNMYKTYTEGVLSNLAVKDEYTYYFNEYNLVTHRTETITWYKEDESVGTIKNVTKYYNLNDAIKEGVRRRNNLLDKAKAYGLATIEGTHASGVPNSYYWFSTMKAEVKDYVDGTLKQNLIDFIDDETETYITQTIKDTMTGILDYWTA